VPPDPLSIVTDYCNGGSLSEYLKNHPKILISEKIQFIKDIAKGKRVSLRNISYCNLLFVFRILSYIYIAEFPERK